MSDFSKTVSDGMKRASSAFTGIVGPKGFRRGSGRKWVRQVDGCEEQISITRSGATYGMPSSARVILQVALSSRQLPDGAAIHLSHHETGKIRRSTGYCYHHRFDAETGSTFDRCVEELELFVEEVAEPWFRERRAAS
ncbi:MAG: hypothetical protein CMN71_09875 [Sphingomonadaceae bacterium]|nr:hypothetical protein [Sphingomonadaceae bacterium]|tara:strand:- start:210 stop:623 length:414 start_codon:yes stop_codon:yes gene_type:complete